MDAHFHFRSAWCSSRRLSVLGALVATLGCSNNDRESSAAAQPASGGRTTGNTAGGTTERTATSRSSAGGIGPGSVSNSPEGGTGATDTTRGGAAQTVTASGDAGGSPSSARTGSGGIGSATVTLGGTSAASSGIAPGGRSSGPEGGTHRGGAGNGTAGITTRGGAAPVSNTSSAAAGSATVGGSGVTVQPTQCQAYFDFETLVDGKVADRSGHGSNLTVDQGKLTAGPQGNYFALTGTNSSATAASPVIDATASFSISVWVRLDRLDPYSTFVSQDGKNISAFYLQKRNSNLFALATFPADSVDASGCVTEGAIQPRVGEWYHLVATRNASTREQRLYVDGMLSGKSTCDGGFATTLPLIVGRGRWQGSADWTTGGVDELCALNRVLTPEEIVGLYQQGRPTASNYLFAYFAEQAKGRGDGLRLAQSHDALYWGAIGVGKVFLPPTVGGKSFRDPHVMRDPKGIYHVVWTTSCVPWAESGCVEDKGFGHAQSTDLVHFSDPIFVPIALNVEHVWAPETFYDAAEDQFLLYWSSPLDDNPGAADPHSIYYVLTRDFVTFSAPAVLYSRSGRNFIDATITTHQSGGYLMFLKDEADGQKNIRALSSSVLYGSRAWVSDPSSAVTGNYAAEGPSALLRDGQLYLFFDKYGDGKYGALRSNDLSNLTSPSAWVDISTSVFFAGVRHGTPIEVPWDVYRAVAIEAAQ